MIDKDFFLPRERPADRAELRRFQTVLEAEFLEHSEGQYKTGFRTSCQCWRTRATLPRLGRTSAESDKGII